MKHVLNTTALEQRFQNGFFHARNEGRRTPLEKNSPAPLKNVLGIVWKFTAFSENSSPPWCPKLVTVLGFANVMVRSC